MAEQEVLGGVLVVGRVSDIDRRDRQADEQGQVRKPVYTVFVMGTREVMETWGEDQPAYKVGDQVAFRCSVSLPGERQRRLTYHRIGTLSPANLAAIASAVEKGGK